MASVLQRRNHTLQYFDQYDYPLTKSELDFWLHYSPPNVGGDTGVVYKNGYYLLPGRQKIASTRKTRQQASETKWPVAYSATKSLSRLPTIEAIFVTGALAMNNCPIDDDIDIMIVTSPHTLWLTRFLVYVLLNSRRRPSSLPEHSSARVANKICDNLYLDSSHLYIPRQNLYTAHEILQAKCIFDRSNIANRFLAANTWTQSYLPNAHKQLSEVQFIPPSKPNILIVSLNYLCFLFQYLYMQPKITNEKIGLHSAFFHPRK